MQHPLGMLLKCCLSNLTHLITSVPFADRCPLSSEQASSIKGEGPEPETRARACERTVFTPSKHPEFSLPNYSPTSHCYIPIGLMVIFWIQLFLLVFLLLLLTELTKSTNNNGSQNPDTHTFFQDTIQDKLLMVLQWTVPIPRQAAVTSGASWTHFKKCEK